MGGEIKVCTFEEAWEGMELFWEPWGVSYTIGPTVATKSRTTCAREGEPQDDQLQCH